MATELSKAEWLEFHAAACADALQRFPDAHPDVRQYLGLAILGEYPMEAPIALWMLAPDNAAIQMLICSGLEDGEYLVSAFRGYCRELRRQGVELPEELKEYYEPE